MSIKQRDQKVAGAEPAPAPAPAPQWPTEDAKVRALNTNARHYADHMLRGRAHHERALAKAAEIERTIQQINELDAHRARLEQERQDEAAAARFEHEQGTAYEVMLKAVGAPLPSLEQSPPTGPQGDPRQHAEQFGGPQTGSFPLPVEPVCPCGAPMAIDQALGPIHRFQDGGYEVAGEVCKRLKRNPVEVTS